MNPKQRLTLTTLIKRLALAAVAGAAALLLQGCETTGSAGTGASAPEANAPTTVTKGMSQAEVLAILGEPKAVEEVQQAGVTAEIWRYEREIVKTSTIESDGEQERVYADPETGQFVTVREPIYRNEKVMATIQAEILFVGGEVVALKEKELGPELEVGHR